MTHAVHTPLSESAEIMVSAAPRPRLVEAHGDLLLVNAMQQAEANAADVANQVPNLGLEVAEQNKFAQLLRDKLGHLETYNCARYRQGLALKDKWIAAGRPGL